jgi:thiol-disulfide isomerase/thioredoxin
MNPENPLENFLDILRGMPPVGAALAAITFMFGTNFAAKAAPTKEDRAKELFGMKWLLALLLGISAASAAAETNGHDNYAVHDDETRHARFPLSSSLPQAGESDKVSLREFHIKPFVRGSQQAIVSSHQGKPFILALWSLDCTHCVDDMILFGKLAKKYREFDLVLVSTDAPEQQQEIARTLQHYRLGQAESWVFADSYAERLRFEVDPEWYGELPRTYFFDAAGNSTAVSGKIERAQIERWLRENRKHA